jgi:hypothetical protein
MPLLHEIINYKQIPPYRAWIEMVGHPTVLRYVQPCYKIKNLKTKQCTFCSTISLIMISAASFVDTPNISLAILRRKLCNCDSFIFQSRYGCFSHTFVLLNSAIRFAYCITGHYFGIFRQVFDVFIVACRFPGPNAVRLGGRVGKASLRP